MDGYPNPPTSEGQKDFLIDLTSYVISNGGLGVIYWEPAWILTNCYTLWGQGSHYENATFFDFDNNLLPAIQYFEFNYLSSYLQVNDKSYNISPNSVIDVLEIENLDQLTDIEIYNSMGKLISEFKNIQTRQYSINLSKLSKGLYFLKLE